MNKSKPGFVEIEYKLRFLPSAEKELEKLSVAVQESLFTRLDKLGQNPQPQGCVKLQTEKPLYRIRVGDYRVIYQVDKTVRSINIEHIRHRKDIYRDLD